MTKSTRGLLKLSVPKSSGKTGEDVTEWLDVVEVNLASVNSARDVDAVKATATFLRGAALRWYCRWSRSVPPEIVIDMDKFRS